MLDWSATRITTDLDLERSGTTIGDLRLKFSDNRYPLGYIPVPIGVIAGRVGPTVLLTAGVHGDEFEGPVALLDLLHTASPAEVRGRIIVLPALNAPAVRESSRVSTLDGVNLNRAFPGDPHGGPTAMIAHFVEEILLPHCDAALDLHSGGKAAYFTPCAMAGRDTAGNVSAANVALAEAFGAPLVWIMGALNDNRSLNGAAARKGIDMIAVELGGGGAVTTGPLAAAKRGIIGFLRQVGLLDGIVGPGNARHVELGSAEQNLHSPRDGLFEPMFDAGEEVTQGQPAGLVYSLSEPERPPARLQFACSGTVLCRSNRGLVERGDLLASVAVDVATLTPGP
ncbi:MAG: succinylglutamate desuccinylase/aspartoacylase family protein [Gammaproteobacteria bacterium]